MLSSVKLHFSGDNSIGLEKICSAHASCRLWLIIFGSPPKMKGLSLLLYIHTPLFFLWKSDKTYSAFKSRLGTHNKITPWGGGLGSGHFCYVAKLFFAKKVSIWWNFGWPDGPKTKQIMGQNLKEWDLFLFILSLNMVQKFGYKISDHPKFYVKL